MGLYKVFLGEEFGESEERVGVVVADSIEQAVDKLREWAERDMYSAEYQAQHLYTQHDVGRSYLAFNVKDDESEGRDIYVVQPVGEDVLMWLHMDWGLIFRYDE